MHQESVRHYPLPMARFGTNPYGETLFRVVFADSRRSIIYGEWADGSTEARMETRYPQFSGKWVLERWIPAVEYAQCTPEEWDRKFTILGPYPTRGEYELCHVFEACGPVDANLGKLISWIEEGRKKSFAEVKQGVTAEYKRNEAEGRREGYDLIYDSLSAYLDHPFSGYGGGRNTKNVPISRSAESLNLPTSNKLIAGEKPYERITQNQR